MGRYFKTDKLIDGISDTLTLGAYGRVREFLLEIPNRYVHFGDLDLGGVCIYLNEFRKVLGERASMLVPDGYEELLRHGDKKLYQHELRPDVSLGERVAPLVDMITRFKTGVEQEKLAWRRLSNKMTIYLKTKYHATEQSRSLQLHEQSFPGL